MAKKIKVKLILELRATQMSQREICRTRKISQHSVSDVYKIAEQLGITYEDIKDKSEEEVYRMFYPDKFSYESLYEKPDYNYVHAELKKTGVNLKLLWKESPSFSCINPIERSGCSPALPYPLNR